MGDERIIVVVGPTASGKSALAVELALCFGGEVVSADSMQVYRHMDIGTAKPGADERAGVVHHMIDMVEPDEEYTAARYMDEAARCVRGIISKGRVPVVAGGTGLYIKVLLGGLFDGPGADPALRERLLREARGPDVGGLHARLAEVDPQSASAIHPNNIRRIIRALEVYEITGRPISEHHRVHAFSQRGFKALKIGLAPERERLYEAIDARVDGMMERGLVEETGRLLEMGYSRDLKPMCALGYKETGAYLDGECTLDEAVSGIKRDTRRYAKRQLTWFRKDEEIMWFGPHEGRRIMEIAQGYLN